MKSPLNILERGARERECIAGYTRFRPVKREINRNEISILSIAKPRRRTKPATENGEGGLGRFPARFRRNCSRDRE